MFWLLTSSYLITGSKKSKLVTICSKSKMWTVIEIDDITICKYQTASNRIITTNIGHKHKHWPHTHFRAINGYLSPRMSWLTFCGDGRGHFCSYCRFLALIESDSTSLCFYLMETILFTLRPVWLGFHVFI